MAAAPIALVIEDDPEAADALALMLGDWGARVVCGADETELLAALADNTDALRWIIADYDLGARQDGVALAQGLTQRFPQARVLVLSGAFSNRASLAARAAGFPMLQKPADAETIAAWLENRPQAA